MWGIVLFVVIFLILILAFAFVGFGGRGDACCEEKPPCKPLVGVSTQLDECGGSWAGVGIIVFLFIIILFACFAWRSAYAECSPIF